MTVYYRFFFFLSNNQRALKIPYPCHFWASQSFVIIFLTLPNCKHSQGSVHPRRAPARGSLYDGRAFCPTTHLFRFTSAPNHVASFKRDCRQVKLRAIYPSLCHCRRIIESNKERKEAEFKCDRSATRALSPARASPRAAR